MKLPHTIEGRFLRRDNRFRVTVEIDGKEVAAHLPNSGRLGELLEPGRPCYLVPQSAEHRRTAYDLLLVEHAGGLVSVDARLPNRLFAEAVKAGALEPFQGTTSVEAEVRHGDSRLDFRLVTPAGICWVEAKSVTLVEDGVALFPDAPTVRGQRHLGDLISLAGEGVRAAAVFIIQRQDATSFSPNEAADPVFAHLLDEAASNGVEVYGFRCAVSRRSMAISAAVPLLKQLPLGTPHEAGTDQPTER